MIRHDIRPRIMMASLTVELTSVVTERISDKDIMVMKEHFGTLRNCVNLESNSRVREMISREFMVISSANCKHMLHLLG